MRKTVGMMVLILGFSGLTLAAGEGDENTASWWRYYKNGSRRKRPPAGNPPSDGKTNGDHENTGSGGNTPPGGNNTPGGNPHDDDIAWTVPHGGGGDPPHGDHDGGFTVPEIDPGSGTSALTLLSGALLVMRGRRKTRDSGSNRS